MNWTYVERGGKEYCVATQATFECRLANPQWKADINSAPDWVADANVDPEKMAAILRRAHKTTSGHSRARVDGKLTDRCEVCGGKMDRLGFAAWVSVPEAPDSTRQGLADRLGMGEQRTREGEVRYFATKKEAAAWQGEDES